MSIHDMKGFEDPTVLDPTTNLPEQSLEGEINSYLNLISDLKADLSGEKRAIVWEVIDKFEMFFRTLQEEMNNLQDERNLKLVREVLSWVDECWEASYESFHKGADQSYFVELDRHLKEGFLVFSKFVQDASHLEELNSEKNAEIKERVTHKTQTSRVAVRTFLIKASAIAGLITTNTLEKGPSNISPPLNTPPTIADPEKPVKASPAEQTIDEIAEILRQEVIEKEVPEKSAEYAPHYTHLIETERSIMEARYLNDVSKPQKLKDLKAMITDFGKSPLRPTFDNMQIIPAFVGLVESDLNPDAYNKGSKAVGMFQFLLRSGPFGNPKVLDKIMANPELFDIGFMDMLKKLKQESENIYFFDYVQDKLKSDSEFKQEYLKELKKIAFDYKQSHQIAMFYLKTLQDQVINLETSHRVEFRSPKDVGDFTLFAYNAGMTFTKAVVAAIKQNPNIEFTEEGRHLAISMDQIAQYAEYIIEKLEANTHKKQGDLYSGIAKNQIRGKFHEAIRYPARLRIAQEMHQKSSPELSVTQTQ